MRALSRLGYRARPFGEIVAAVVCGHTLPKRTFAITFDDGYGSVGERAAPILAAHGFPATVFVVSNWVGGANVWDRAFPHPELPLLDWDALRRLRSAGWEIGGHTLSHPHLDTLDDTAALLEIVAGKEEAEARLGCGLETFCYPFGHLNAHTPTLVKAAGFLGACTARSGLVQARSDPFTLPRIKIAYRDGLTGLLFRLFARPHLPNTRPLRRSYRPPS